MSRPGSGHLNNSFSPAGFVAKENSLGAPRSTYHYSLFTIHYSLLTHLLNSDHSANENSAASVGKKEGSGYRECPLMSGNQVDARAGR